LSGSGTITINLDIPAVAGRYTVFEFTGIDAANPWVASNIQLNNGSAIGSSLTPNPLQSGHNAYLAVSWHNSTEEVNPKLVPSEEIFDSNNVSSDGHELNYYVGWNGGTMGATWYLVATYRALGVEIAYDPASVPPAPIFPRRPETFPKATISEAFNTFGPPILAQQPMPMDIAAIIGDITILPTIATATADANIPTILVTILPAIATATADALTPTLQVTLLPSIATATADAILPASNFLFLDQPAGFSRIPGLFTPFGLPLLAKQPSPAAQPLVGDIIISPSTAAATAAGLAPTLIVTLLPAQATATATSLTPTIQVTILPAIATATAAGSVPTLQVTIAPAIATATAVGLVPNLVLPITILAPIATATAAGLVPTIVTVVIFITDVDSTVSGMQMDSSSTGLDSDSAISGLQGDSGTTGKDADSGVTDFGS
jgi:hypothetical protein